MFRDSEDKARPRIGGIATMRVLCWGNLGAGFISCFSTSLLFTLLNGWECELTNTSMWHSMDIGHRNLWFLFKSPGLFSWIFLHCIMTIQSSKKKDPYLNSHSDPSILFTLCNFWNYTNLAPSLTVLIFSCVPQFFLFLLRMEVQRELKTRIRVKISDKEQWLPRS